MKLRIAVAAASLWAGAAAGLSQENHYQLTVDACVAAGLPAASCREIGVANHNTDAHEWEDLAAHAQIPETGTVCAAINDTFSRVHGLGASTRAALIAQMDTSRPVDEVISSARQALTELGRALHTVQDNCAHHGVPNPQHAWYSVSDLCLSTKLSPDIRIDAVACAKAETARVFATVRATLDELGLAPSDLYQGDPVNKTPKLWPTRAGLCEFVRSPKKWDGADRGWDSSYVQPGLLEELSGGMSAAPQGRDACSEPAEVIALKDPQPTIKTSELTCDAVDAVCAGDPKSRDEVPPWENDLARALSAACTAAPGAFPGLIGAVVIALLLRRRKSS